MNSFTIELLGHKLSIKTEESEDHIGKLIECIRTKMEQLNPGKTLPETTRLLLCLLNLADDLFKEKQRKIQIGDKEKEAAEATDTIPPNSTIH